MGKGNDEYPKEAGVIMNFVSLYGYEIIISLLILIIAILMTRK